jgi:hypothetical protein
MEPALTDSIHRRVVRRACEILGSQHLAERIDASHAMVLSWVAGTAAPPPRAFLKILSLLRAADPAYRPNQNAATRDA